MIRPSPQPRGSDPGHQDKVVLVRWLGGRAWDALRPVRVSIRSLPGESALLELSLLEPCLSRARELSRWLWLL